MRSAEVNVGRLRESLGGLKVPRPERFDVPEPTGGLPAPVGKRPVDAGKTWGQGEGFPKLPGGEGGATMPPISKIDVPAERFPQGAGKTWDKGAGFPKLPGSDGASQVPLKLEEASKGQKDFNDGLGRMREQMDKLKVAMEPRNLKESVAATLEMQKAQEDYAKAVKRERAKQEGGLLGEIGNTIGGPLGRLLEGIGKRVQGIAGMFQGGKTDTGLKVPAAEKSTAALPGPAAQSGAAAPAPAGDAGLTELAKGARESRRGAQGTGQRCQDRQPEAASRAGPAATRERRAQTAQSLHGRRRGIHPVPLPQGRRRRIQRWRRGRGGRRRRVIRSCRRGGDSTRRRGGGSRRRHHRFQGRQPGIARDRRTVQPRSRTRQP